MIDRKIIFKARVGSHLHGTSTPKSDEDFLGVFLPSTEDLLGLQNRPSEWTENEKLSEGPRNEKGDTDCKYLAIYEFFRQAAQGQSQALELFYVPKEHVIISTPEWDRIVMNRHLFVSRKGILPIIGFAIAQMHKATIKGENLNKINTLIESCNERIANGLGRDSIVAHLEWPGDMYEKEEGDPSAWLFGVPVHFHTNEHGYKLVRIAGRDYDIGTTIKRFREGLETLEAKYGSRTRLAAQMTYDYKSVTHAFRLIGEAEEFIQTGHITFPRPDAEFLLKVKNKEYEGDVSAEIDKRLDNLRQNLEPNSSLQLTPNHSKINQLCIDMLSSHTWEGPVG
jgi:hypothetical protein